MTLQGNAKVADAGAGSMGTDDDGQAKPQAIARGPVAAVVAIKQLGTNGGGFFGANSAHPFENPNAWTNFLTCARASSSSRWPLVSCSAGCSTTCGTPPSSSASCWCMLGRH